MNYLNVYFILLIFIKLCLTFDNYEQCLSRDTCANSSRTSPTIYDDSNLIRTRNCFCDSICQHYNDCCDKENSSSNENLYECIDYLSPTINSTSFSYNSLPVWMRRRCLSVYIGSNIDKQCQNLDNISFSQNPFFFIPVTSRTTNITYRNYFCAYCNNDIDQYIQFWEYKAFCHGNGSETDYVTLNSNDKVNHYIMNLTKTCLKTILYPHERGKSQPSVFIRPCKISLPKICPIGTSIELSNNCSLSSTAYRYITDTNVIYANSYCAQCNHMNETNRITCIDPILRTSVPPIYNIRVHPLSMLFDPEFVKSYAIKQRSDNTKTRVIYLMNYNCKDKNQLYDSIEKKCKFITNEIRELILLMNCSKAVQTLIDKNDQMYRNNGSIYLVDYSLLLLIDEYITLNDNQVLFCADKLTDITLTNSPVSFPIYRNILSIICTSVSLLSLFLFIIMFVSLPSLHNFPGKCLLLLSISLFIGQLIFISTSDSVHHYSLCFVSAIFIHYFYLSSFLWLLMLSINIYLTFHYDRIQRTHLESRPYRFLSYNILVWCSAGTIVLISCLIQILYPDSDYSPSYGFIYCGISNFNAMIIFFLLPIGCILIAILFLFIKTLFSIYRSRRLTKLARATSTSNINNQNLTIIYIRLASLMGLQWLLLILALIVRQTWLWVIFEIVNSLPGLFICFGFLFSKKIFKSLKDKFSLKLLVRRQSSRSNVTTSTKLMSPIQSSRMNPVNRIRF